eukprot:4419539-Pleurochrysis_carterae.AAC.1
MAATRLTYRWKLRARVQRAHNMSVKDRVSALGSTPRAGIGRRGKHRNDEKKEIDEKTRQKLGMWVRVSGMKRRAALGGKSQNKRLEEKVRTSGMSGAGEQGH